MANFFSPVTPLGLLTLMGQGSSVCTDKDLDAQCPKHAACVVDSSTKNSISETSTGFHLFEFHMPSILSGLGIIIAIIFVVAVIVLLYKYCKARTRRLRQAEATAAGLSGCDRPVRAKYNAYGPAGPSVTLPDFRTASSYMAAPPTVIHTAPPAITLASAPPDPVAEAYKKKILAIA